jgi:hypothetical protein
MRVGISQPSTMAALLRDPLIAVLPIASFMTYSLLLDHLKDPGSSWSVGRFGAIAEFHRDLDEPAALTSTDAAISVSTDRGAIRIDVRQPVRPIAYETISSCIESWGQGVALCLPSDVATMSGRDAVTELGPDGQSVRPQDREAILFDLGIGGEQAEICVRSADPEVISLLRSACGHPLFSMEHALMPRMLTLSPHRVFCCRMGRVEVFQPIPPPNGKSPDGPHTHVLPRLLAQGRGQAATVPVPDGWLAGMTLHPPHPLLSESGEATSFDAARYDAFQSLMKRYGDPSQLAGKLAAFAMATSIDEESVDNARGHALGVRIGRRQLKWLQVAFE